MHKFIYENNYDGQIHSKVEFEFSQDASLPDMLEQFTYYLKACGFQIGQDEYLDFVSDNDDYDESQESWSDEHTITLSPDDNISFTEDDSYTFWPDNTYGDVTVTFSDDFIEKKKKKKS